MLFHVRMDVRLPADTPADVANEIKAREKAYSQDLQRSGKWRHIWRLVGEYANVSVFDVQSNGIDLVIGIPLKIGVGYGLPWPEVLPFVPEGRVCFGCGAGGSMVIVNADLRMTVAYVMNQMAPYRSSRRSQRRWLSGWTTP